MNGARSDCLYENRRALFFLRTSFRVLGTWYAGLKTINDGSPIARRLAQHCSLRY